MQAIDRRERLRRLALETIDLAKDPYYMRNHLGQIECRLCLTLHSNEGNYLAHTQVLLLLVMMVCRDSPPAYLPPPRTPGSLDCLCSVPPRWLHRCLLLTLLAHLIAYPLCPLAGFTIVCCSLLCCSWPLSAAHLIA